MIRANAFLALRMNAAPLPEDHGGPVRLVVPGWDGCCCIKWVNRVELVDRNQSATSQMKEYTGAHASERPSCARATTSRR